MVVKENSLLNKFQETIETITYRDTGWALHAERARISYNMEQYHL